MKATLYRSIWVLLLFVAGRASAFHLVGGDISMNHLGRPGYFRLTVNQYWDEVGIARNNNTPNYETALTVYVFNLRTRQRVDQFILQQQDKQPLTYRNEACAQTAGLRTSEVHYTADVQFDVNRYTDPAGYYVVWERCCRNAAIDNILNPNQMGQVFYLEFPAMIQNGRNFTNSAPDFSLPNGEYVCLNRPFALDFGATDKDGDALSYRFITPWSGYTGPALGMSTNDGTSHASYPTVTWKPGFSEQSIIPGPSPLAIDVRTGRISVIAGQQGLFVFSVEVTESRNGQPIGRVHRDFQLLVVDCSVAVPPPAVVSYLDQPATTVDFCAGSSAVLTVEDNPDWAYQWQKDGINITGAKSTTLAVQQPGNYAVVKSLARTCSRDTASVLVGVTRRELAVVKITPAPALTVCAGTAVALQTNATTGGLLQWTRNGQPATDLPPTPSVTVRQTGMYAVTYTETGNPCPGHDSVAVVVNPQPAASISGSPGVLCGTDTTQLRTSAIANGRYVWTRNAATFAPTATTSVAATQAGTYQVTITDANNCSAVSAPLVLTQVSRPVIRFDSLAPVCDAQGAAVALSAQPPGGLFSGSGVSGASFNPSLTGAGRFPIVYQYTDANGCRTKQQRIVDVQEFIGLTVPASLTLSGGDSVQIPATVRVPLASVGWSPPAGLNSAALLQPTTGTRQSTTYAVQVKTPLGCIATATVQVDIAERLLFPSAFTPNADGQNDTWEIHGLQSFDYIEVFIYNRWGSVVYHSKGYDQPWDGTYRGQRVEPGDYAYRVLTNIGSVRYAGHVLVLY